MIRIFSGLCALSILAASLVALPFLIAPPYADGQQSTLPFGTAPTGEDANRPPPPPGFGPPGFGVPPLRVLEALDIDKNGELSSDELANASQALLTLDADADGKLNEEEFRPPRIVVVGGPGGPGGPNSIRELLNQFDLDKNGRLSKDERAEARKVAGSSGRGPGGPDGPGAGPGGRGPGGGFGGPGGPGGGPGGGPPRLSLEPAKPGIPLAPKDVTSYASEGLYDLNVLRTLFLDFENKDWEEELEAFNNTDVDVPARLTVDGKVYPSVGIHFRGSSSYFAIPRGHKRSLNVSIDFEDASQRLYGYKTLNLLNANDDPSMLSSVLYSNVASQYLPAPKANFVRVVINGENWGVYVNVQQFNKEFLQEHLGTSKGTRWKVSGRPGSDSGLRYLGEQVEDYRQRYTIKSNDNEESWKALIELCRVLDQTPPDQLEAALSPILDIDSTLWFLALDCALVNNDGYWVRASDYNLYRSEEGRFMLIPHDMNEAFRSPMGGPGGGGPGGPPELVGGFGPPGFGPPGFGPPGFGPPGFGPPGFGHPDFGPPGFGPPEGGRNDGPPSGRDTGRRSGGRLQRDLDPLTAMDDPTKPLRGKLLAVPKLRERYLQFVRTIAERSLTWDKIGPIVASTRTLLDEDVARDTKKLGTYEEFLATTTNEATDPSSMGRHASVRSFIDHRSKYLLSYPEIAILASVESPARASVSQASSSQATKSTQPKIMMNLDKGTLAKHGNDTNQLRINELMASNTKSIKDPDGNFDDWIELYNPTDKPVELDGMFLTDTDQAPRKWQFPAGTRIEPRGYLVIWADEDGKSKQGVHVNFKLSSKGESLYLVDRDDRNNTVIDHVSFEVQTNDVAFGRHPRSPETWQPLVPTPGAANRDSE